jgi:hypothetical protein
MDNAVVGLFQPYVCKNDQWHSLYCGYATITCNKNVTQNYPNNNIYISVSYLMEKQTALIASFLHFNRQIRSAKRVNGDLLDALLVALDGIANNIRAVMVSDELRTDATAYENILDRIESAYNELTTFLRENAEVLQAYAVRAKKLDAYRVTLINLSDQLFFANDREIGDVLKKLEAACMKAGSDNGA